jgi:serine/threonine-protein kinase
MYENNQIYKQVKPMDNDFLANYKKKQETTAAELEKTSVSSMNYEQKSKFTPPAKEIAEDRVQVRAMEQRNKMIFAGALTIIGVVFLIFLILVLRNPAVSVPDFTNWKTTEVQAWSELNKGIIIKTDSVFNDDVEESRVISQGTEPNTKVKKGDTILLVVSKGHDMSVTFALPDFHNMTREQIEKWAQERYLSKLRIVTESSDSIPAGQVIRFEVNDDTVTNEIRRDTPLYITVSRGEEAALRNISVPDFKGKARMDVMVWAEEHGVTITYQEQGSETIPADGVISQSYSKGERIAKKDEFTVVISLGKGVPVPNYMSILRDRAEAAEPGLMVTVVPHYSATVAYGKAISQSVPAGTKLYGEDKRVTVTYSEGRPFIDDLIGSPEKDLAAYFYDFKLKGANITYSVTYVNSSEPKGTVVKSSKNSEFVPMSQVVYIEVSRGNQ